MPDPKPLSPEAKKKILAELQKGKKSLDDLISRLQKADVDAEKIEKANQ